MSQDSKIINANKLEGFESISPTAILTSYPRIFTDIPYEKEIYDWLSRNCNTDIKLNKMLAPEIEARYKLTNSLLEKSGIKQVLEIAAGYSSRGLIYSKKGYEYVEIDLDEVARNKKNILQDISNINNNLHIISGNVLNEDELQKCEKYFNKDEELVIINEGLLRYLTFTEKKVVATNIYNILKKYNGIWITCDVTPKKFIDTQNNIMPDFNNNLNTVTSRNDLKDRFNDIEHINSFMKEIGFNSVEIHKFIEMKDKLTSFDILGVDKNQYDELLDKAIVAVIKI